MTVRNLDRLLAPASVALVGVSDRPGNLGRVVLRNLREGGFAGEVWLVNKRHARVAGEPAWPAVDALPAAPDLAIICTPPETVPDVIARLGRMGGRAAVVLSAGLKRPVAPGGPTLEQAMLDAARPFLLRILGPNCLGLLVPRLGLNASFAPARARDGGLAFLSQSGALATGLLDWANSRDIGFSHFVTLGDCADVDFGDLLDYLGSDPQTRAILLYMESVKAARKFMSAARAASRNKPVIVVKAGRAPEGARAAASHTGAMAGSDAVFDAAVRRAGMLRVDTLDALFDAAETLARAKPWRGHRLALLTNGGGAGVLAADALARGGGTLAALGQATLAALDGCLPATWPRGNPVDIIGDAPAQRYADALGVLLQAPDVDGVLFMHAPTAVVGASDIAAQLLPLMQASAKPILSCWLGGTVVVDARQACRDAGVPTYDTPERAVAAWLQMASHASSQAVLRQLAPATAPFLRADRAAAQGLLDLAFREGRDWLDEAEAKQVLACYGIQTVPTRKVQTVEAAVAAAITLGYPVALKIVSPQVTHKTDAGGVALGLANAADVRAAAARMRDDLARLRPDARITGFTVQAMVRRTGAHELIAGIAGDPQFGPVVLFGEGGTAVELRHDRAVGLPPLNDALAGDLVAATRISALLAGYRGRPAVDGQALRDTLVKLSRMACDLPMLAELDINPLLADADGVVALDARVRVRARPRGRDAEPAIRPYPDELEESIELGGAVLQLRPIRPEDGTRLQAFYRRATPADLRLRFFMSRREIPVSELARYSQIDYDRAMTLVALAPDPEGGEPVMAGEVLAVCDPDNERAEFAVQVATDWKGRGLGRILMLRIMDCLRRRGTGVVEGTCLNENKAMAELARSLGFSVSAEPAEGCLRMLLALRPADQPQAG